MQHLQHCNKCNKRDSPYEPRLFFKMVKSVLSNKDKVRKYLVEILAVIHS